MQAHQVARHRQQPVADSVVAACVQALVVPPHQAVLILPIPELRHALRRPRA
jgi:hypothetical protein